jgi:hypothetical protein
MHLRVHLSWIIIVAPPSDIAISHVPGAGVPGNGAAAIGIIEAVIAGFFASGQQSLAMLLDMILDLSAGHGEGIGLVLECGMGCDRARRDSSFGESPERSPSTGNRYPERT